MDTNPTPPTPARIRYVALLAACNADQDERLRLLREASAVMMAEDAARHAVFLSRLDRFVDTLCDIVPGETFLDYVDRSTDRLFAGRTA